jgi:hypothetical protein
MAAIINERVMAGPVYSAATMPVTDNKPAPTMTPTPKAMSLKGPSTRFSEEAPSSEASARSDDNDFLMKSPTEIKIYVFEVFDGFRELRELRKLREFRELGELRKLRGL